MNSSVVVVEVISFLIRIKNMIVVIDVVSIIIKGRFFFFFICFKVNVLESVLMGINVNRINDEKVMVRVRVNKVSKFIFGFMNIVLNSDVKVLFIMGDKKEVV